MNTEKHYVLLWNYRTAPRVKYKQSLRRRKRDFRVAPLSGYEVVPGWLPLGRYADKHSALIAENEIENRSMGKTPDEWEEMLRDMAQKCLAVVSA